MLKGVHSTDEEKETAEIFPSHLRNSQVEKKQIFASDSNQIKEYTDKIKNLEHLLLNQKKNYSGRSFRLTRKDKKSENRTVI